MSDETLAIAIKNTGDIKVFGSCPVLFDFFSAKYFVQPCLLKQVLLITHPSPLGSLII